MVAVPSVDAAPVWFCDAYLNMHVTLGCAGLEKRYIAVNESLPVKLGRNRNAGHILCTRLELHGKNGRNERDLAQTQATIERIDILIQYSISCSIQNTQKRRTAGGLCTGHKYRATNPAFKPRCSGHPTTARF